MTVLKAVILTEDEIEQIASLCCYAPCYYEPDPDSEADCPLVVECGRGAKDLCLKLARVLDLNKREITDGQQPTE